MEAMEFLDEQVQKDTEKGPTKVSIFVFLQT